MIFYSRKHNISSGYQNYTDCWTLRSSSPDRYLNSHYRMSKLQALCYIVVMLFHKYRAEYEYLYIRNDFARVQNCWTTTFLFVFTAISRGIWFGGGEVGVVSKRRNKRSASRGHLIVLAMWWCDSAKPIEHTLRPNPIPERINVEVQR